MMMTIDFKNNENDKKNVNQLSISYSNLTRNSKYHMTFKILKFAPSGHQKTKRP